MTLNGISSGLMWTNKILSMIIMVATIRITSFHADNVRYDFQRPSLTSIPRLGKITI